MESARGKYGGGGGSTVGTVRLSGRLYLGFVLGSVLGSAANFFQWILRDRHEAPALLVMINSDSWVEAPCLPL